MALADTIRDLNDHSNALERQLKDFDQNLTTGLQELRAEFRAQVRLSLRAPALIVLLGFVRPVLKTSNSLAFDSYSARHSSLLQQKSIPLSPYRSHSFLPNCLERNLGRSKGPSRTSKAPSINHV
jgi:hypothetical protein